MFTITDAEGEYMVKLARATIEAELGLRDAPVTGDAPKVMQQTCGVFVTLNKTGAEGHSLRGCIGYPYPVKRLLDALTESASNAAFDDPRFPPVKASEMGRIVVEVSVLTPPEKVKVKSPKEYPGSVRVGTDGLIMSRVGRRGLLLPQVATDWEWDPEEFLSQCCIKAGLPPDAWMVEGTEVQRFQAIIFAEENPGGAVTRQVIN